VTSPLRGIAGVTLLSALFGIALSASPSPGQLTANNLVRNALEKQKRHQFWFRLRSIAFGKVPYVFNVRTSTLKYDGKGNAKKLLKDGHSSGIWICEENYTCPVTRTVRCLLI